MKNYKVFKHTDGRIEAVKQGWSWPAFVLELFGLGFIWGLVKKLWLVAILLIIFRVVLFVISSSVTPDIESYNNYYEYQRAMESALNYSLVFLVIQLGVAIFVGVKGNAFRETDLIKKGYQLIGTVSALNPDMAVAESRKSDSTMTTEANKPENNDIISRM